MDAEFEVVGPAQTLPLAQQPARPAADDAGLSLFADTAPASDGARRRGGVAFWLGGAAVAAGAFWFAGGHAMVDAARLAGAGGATVFSLVDVRSRVDLSGANPILMVDGYALNGGGSRAVVPPIEVRVAADGGHVLRYKLGTAAASVEPGGRFAFSSRLDLPKNEIRKVSVTFTE